MKMYGIGVFLKNFETFWKNLRRFGKVLPYPPLSTAFEKVWGGGGIFDPYLCFFLHFRSKTTLPNLSVWFQ